MALRYLFVHKPVLVLVEIPSGDSKITEQTFQIEDEIQFTYFQVIDNGIPQDIYDIINKNPYTATKWKGFKQDTPTLATIISEALLSIGIRI